MAQQLYTNNAASTLAGGISDSATTLAVASGHGARFAAPSGGDWQMLTLVSAAGAIEIVKCTARATDVLTITRAQEGTTALTLAGGDKVEARLTSGMLAALLKNTHTTGSGLAINTNTVVSADFAVAIGKNAKADSEGSIAIGANQARAYRQSQLSIHAIPCIPREDWWAPWGMQYNAGMETTWAGYFADLGTPAAWQAATTYTEGAVVQPTTPNGLQYRLQFTAFDSTVLNTVASGATEPTWPTAVDDSVPVNASPDHDWIAADPLAGIPDEWPAGMVFYPTEVGFICFGHSGVSAAPYVSIGTAAAPTLLVNNQQLSDITAAQMRHAFTGLKHGIEDILFTLETPATGASARFHGRFYAKGIFIQTQG